MSHRKKKIIQKKQRFQRKKVKIFVRKKVKEKIYEFVHQKFEQKQSTHTTEKKKTLCQSWVIKDKYG